MTPDMILVCMPYAELPRPPLAPGLLAAIMRRDGLVCETVYANLLFAERIGIDLWKSVVKTHPDHFMPEFVFSHIAFPEQDRGVLPYIHDLEGRHWSVRGLLKNGQDRRLEELRAEASIFVRELAETILQKNPAVVGCSSTFIQQVPSLALLRVIKELSPDTVTMLGGANCEATLGMTAHSNCSWVDVVVSGEADGVLSTLVRDLVEHGPDLPPKKVPDGVFVPGHRRNGYPPQPGRLSFRNLDSLPVPDYREFFTTLEQCPSIRDKGHFALTAESSRGCWWGQHKGCTFCGLNGKGAEYAVKDPNRFLDELQELKNRHEINRFSLADNIIAKEYFKTLLPMLEEKGAPYSLFYETKSNLRRRHMKAFRNAGIYWIQPGIESLSSGLLAHMRKGARAWEQVHMLRLAMEYGIRIQWFILHGFPGEKEEWYAEMADLVPLLTHLQPPVNMIPLQFRRFSEYFDNAEAYGLDLAAPPMAGHVYPFEPKIVEGFLSTFELRQKHPGSSDILSLLNDMPAKRRLRGALGAWIQAFWDRQPILEMHDTADGLVVHDTRAVATQPKHTLTGELRNIYISACEECPGLEQISDRSGIEYLLEHGLAALLDDRLVGLAMFPPKYTFPPRHAYPGGTLARKGEDRSSLG